MEIRFGPNYCLPPNSSTYFEVEEMFEGGVYMSWCFWDPPRSRADESCHDHCSLWRCYPSRYHTATLIFIGKAKTTGHEAKLCCIPPPLTLFSAQLCFLQEIFSPPPQRKGLENIPSRPRDAICVLSPALSVQCNPEDRRDVEHGGK